jgi:arabinofuranosyltransferase
LKQQRERWQFSITDSAPQTWILVASVSLFFVVLLNAWVCDDAYITFRTSYNLTHGHGPVYNLSERVQTYTNPLWMLLFSGVYFFTGEAYFTAIGLSLVILSGTILVLHRHIFRGSWAGVMVVFLLGWSVSFVEYSTSGLENALNGLLLTLFYSVFWNVEFGRRKVLMLTLIAAFGMVSRMDTALLYLPALITLAWQMRTGKLWRWLAIGFLPFLLWEVFAIIYYGFPFPNTAYAKLNAGISQAEYWQQGFWYYLNCLQHDPMTLMTIVVGLLMSLVPSFRRERMLAIGICLYGIYIARIGGDFMAGRFFFLPFLGSAILLGRAIESRIAGRWIWLGLFTVGILNSLNPWYNGWRPQQPRKANIDAHGIANERAWYHDAAALTAVDDTMWALRNERRLDENSVQHGEEKVLFWDYLGYQGYGEGPNAHLVDRYALADPLLARLPASDLPDWRIGHFERVFPRGYRKTLRTGENHIEDGQLREYYNRMCTVIKGPLWSVKRWSEIYHLNFGKYERLINKDFYRHPSRLDVRLTELSIRHPAGEPYGSNGQVEIYNHRPLTVHLGYQMPFRTFEISLFLPAEYILQFLKEGVVQAELRIPGNASQSGIVIDTIPVPEPAAKVGFDAIRIEGIAGNEYYSVGHLVPMNSNN